MYFDRQDKVMWMWENRKFRKCAKILGVTAAVYGVFRFLLPLVAPFVFAWLTALALKPLACRISGILRVRWRGRSVGISVGAAGLLELAVILGVEEADVVSEMEAMEREGVICGYHTMIDWEKTSIEKVTALIEVRVTPQRGQGFDNIAERIYKYPEVNSVYLISGGYDLLVTLEGKSLKEVSSFVSDKLSTLDTVLSTATHFILKKYKDHGTILAKKYEDEREKITP